MTVVNDLAAALAKTAKRLAEVLESIPQTKHNADAYAQTVAYGIFVGRLYDQKLTNVLKLLPHLSFFDDFAGHDVDERIRPIVDEIERIVQSSDMELVQKNFGTAINTDDVVVYFYEHFLAAYNPALRKKVGVFYTPQPVVRYIVRAVDDILRQEFKLPEGLADTAKIVSIGQTIHRVQILDPATGTGTFLAEVVKYIHASYVENNGQGMWSDYAVNELLPRLHGIEVMMTPYGIAHLKLAMLFEQTGCRFEKHQQLNIHLANALETNNQPVPIMVVLGNPPYNVSTCNNGKFAKNLLKEYKENLGETKTNLDDDYIKFIALGQQLIEKNPLKEGIVAYITNNSFLTGITHRNMRRSLLKTFDKVYILNLHGDIRKKETTLDGSKDENVFNIRQGTSIIFLIRTLGKNEYKPGQVFYADLFGKRSEKYNFLSTQHLKTSGFIEFVPVKNFYFFVPKDFSAKKKYDSGFCVSELFLIYNSGIKTDRDSLFIDHDKEQLAERCKRLLSGNFDEPFRKLYRIEDSHSYKITKLIQEKSYDPSCLCRITYRPFDERWIYYDPAIISRPGRKVMRHMRCTNNIALLTSRLIPTNHGFNHVFVTKILADGHAVSDQTYVFPLYAYDLRGRQQSNLDLVIVDKITACVGRDLTALEIFDYIYGVLHDGTYRAKFWEFLKIDFPHIPYPANYKEFERYAKIGAKLRQLHLLE